MAGRGDRAGLREKGAARPLAEQPACHAVLGPLGDGRAGARRVRAPAGATEQQELISVEIHGGSSMSRMVTASVTVRAQREVTQQCECHMVRSAVARYCWWEAELVPA